jgi:hypothetical protein
MKALLIVVDSASEDPRWKAESALVPGGQASPPFSSSQSSPAPTSLFSYLSLGFRHVLPLGLDHVLFMVALVIGSDRKWRRLVLLSGAFTLAHSVTLALGASGIVTIPGRVVEPLIALSIVVVALSNLWRSARPHGAWLVLAFGLLHGLGFASVLGDTGLARGELLVPLLGFNLGVEAAQLVVVALCWLLLWRFAEQRLYTHAVRPASVLIALCGIFWALERVL